MKHRLAAGWLLTAVGLTAAAQEGRAPVIEASSWKTETRTATAAFRPGDRVFHQKFGYGEVLAVDEGRLDVEFATGRKRVLSSFVEKA